MEILNNIEVKKEGNDCLITEAVALIRINYDLYVVIHTDAVDGSWTGNPCDTYTYTFRDFSSAISRYNELCEKVK